jgi:hypothetical protein
MTHHSTYRASLIVVVVILMGLSSIVSPSTVQASSQSIAAGRYKSCLEQADEKGYKMSSRREFLESCIMPGDEQAAQAMEQATAAARYKSCYAEAADKGYEMSSRREFLESCVMPGDAEAAQAVDKAAAQKRQLRICKRSARVQKLSGGTRKLFVEQCVAHGQATQQQ